MQESIRHISPKDMYKFMRQGAKVHLLDVRSPDKFLMCASGKRSEMAAAKLAGQGLENVATVSGGTGAWRKARLPLVVNRRLPTLEQQAQIFLGVRQPFLRQVDFA